MAPRPPRLLATWTAAVLLVGVAAVGAQGTDGADELGVASGVDGATVVTARATTTSTTSITTTTSTTSNEPTTTTTPPPPTAAPLRPTAAAPPSTAPREADPPVTSPGDVPMPPGPWNPVDHLPAGYVPAVDDGYVTVQPNSPQSDDHITPAAGAPYVLQGRVTDERGNLLAGICLEVEHPGFGTVVTGADGVFRFTGPGFEGSAPMPGIPWHIWDCTPGGSPDWAPVNTILSRMTPGDTSTWFWRLGPASRMVGRVVDEATGQPVPGVCVMVDKGTNPSWDPAVSAPTDAAGRFTLEGLGGMDQHARAVPCPGTTVEWQGVPRYLPFRPGYTVVADLTILR